MRSHPDDERQNDVRKGRKEVVSQGKTLDEAVQKGIEELGINKDEAVVEVLEVGGSGIMGRLRGKNAKVRVKAKDARAARLQEVTSEILERMDIEAEVGLEGENGSFNIKVTSEGADGLLIGRRGETLEALQHVVHRIVAGGDGPLFISIDVSGYKERRRLYLEAKARELASTALSQRREVFSEPLTVGERRIFHSAITAIPNVQARALGEGIHRKIVVAPVGGGRGRSSHHPQHERPADRERPASPDRPQSPPQSAPPDRPQSPEQDEERQPQHNRSRDPEFYTQRPRQPSEREGGPRWGSESAREDTRGIPPAPESAVGREWMRQGRPRDRRPNPRRSEFLSPSRGFAGTGYNGNRRDGGEPRNRGGDTRDGNRAQEPKAGAFRRGRRRDDDTAKGNRGPVEGTP